VASVSKESCTNHLKNGYSITIVVGGAQESLMARPGALDLVLHKRKGFVKLAMRNKAFLVPVLAFGENDLYQQVSIESVSFLYKFQQTVKKLMGFTVPLFHARGVFNYDVGLMPYRQAVNVVVGAPISVPFDDDPKPEDVDRVHAEYVKGLRNLWETYRHEFGHGINHFEIRE